MLQVETKIKVSDNSGVRSVRCIHVLGGSKKTYAFACDFVVVAVQKRRRHRRFITKNIYVGLVVSCKKERRRPNGFYIRMQHNKVLLLSDQGVALGSRIFGPVVRELRWASLSKPVALAKAWV